ncbi:flavin reductase family protein [Nocardioides immobilis]|uniref:flavin reductase family protein n=1 Tax=Nocardioides immobilis TaxID=2049295 RepID=UPI001C70CE87|nr:flavin reductase family protein [Nocardioides immobilis]
MPRPIAWVSTLSAQRAHNLAPHSFFTVASARPPIVQFTSVGEKDTLRNVLETGEFVVSLAPLALMDKVNATSAAFAPGLDEAAAVGVVMEASSVVAPPRVMESPASLECRLHSTVPLGESTLVLGNVVAVTVRRSVLVDGHPAMERLQPVSRLGRNEWGLPPEVVALERPMHP